MEKAKEEGEMEESKNYGHQHSLLLLLNQEQLLIVADCSRCGEKVSTPCFSCAEDCGFYHKVSASFDLVEEDERHEHPFNLLTRRSSFIFDACGTEGSYASYLCCKCNIMVHKKCTSLPRIIKSKWHDHPLFHKYFLPNEFTSSDCIICHNEITPEHGSYCCSHCNITFRVRCVTADENSYFIVSLENEDEIEMPNENSISVIERNDAGEAIKIKHIKHMHNLMLGPFVGGYENSCDGCMLPISDPFYYCSKCVFFLHKVCAELLKMKNVWHHYYCQEPLALISDKAFECRQRWHISNAFAYEFSGCKSKTCLRCVIALTPDARTCLKHEHPLFYYRENNGKCNACGTITWEVFCSKVCNILLGVECFSIPITARHKCDEHLLSLTDYDGNNYSKSHRSNICEQSRDPNRWFYHCATCDTSAHVGCVLGNYPFLKLEHL